MSKQSFGLGSIILLGMNTVLGTGIFFLPSKAMALVGPASLFVYFFVTLAATAIAFCFAECATLFSRNGAAYVYAKEAFGDFVGFQVGIMRWISTMIGAAAIAVGWVNLLEHFYPVLFYPFFHVLLIITTIAALALLNISGIGLFSLMSNIAASAKLLLLFLFVGIGVFYMDLSHFAPILTDSIAFDNFGAAALVIFFAFSGFEGLAVASEEMENPRRNIPIAIFIVLLLSALIYFSIHAVLIGILGEGLAHTMLPLAQAAASLGGKKGEMAVLLCMLVASLGSNLAASFSAQRSAVALAQDGMLPPLMAKYGRFRTPTVAILITSAFTCGIALSGSFTTLAGISVFIRLVQYLPTCLAVLVFRFFREDLKSAFSPILGTIMPVLALLVIGWMGFNAPFEAIIFGLLGLLCSVPLYIFQKRRQPVLPVQDN